MTEEERPICLPDIGAARRVAARVILNGPADDEQELSPTGAPTIPNYRIEGMIGAGASGTVFAAVHQPTGRGVAIKVHRRELGAGNGAGRAWRELEILSELRLPCVPLVLDYGETDGHLFIVTERVDGLPLTEHANAFARRERVQLLARVARAVQFLHERGVIHRDLKPANVMVTRCGDPMILDLGIALSSEPDLAATMTLGDTPLGSPAYMAPEQARGDRASISTRTDVHALGAIGYELLAGALPRQLGGGLHEAIRAVAQDPPRDPRLLDPTVPRPLAAVLERAVATDSAHRYGSAADLADDLERWLRGEPVTAVRPTLFQWLWRAAARRPAVASAALSVFVGVAFLLGTVATVWWLNMRPHRIQIDPVESRWVTLMSRTGRELHVWDSGVSRGIVRARMVRRDSDGADIVVIGFRRHEDPLLDGALAAFEIRRPQTPLWSSGSDAHEMGLPAEHPRWDNPYPLAVAVCIFADVFPDLPGPQVISVHPMDTWSPSAIRVTSLDGEVLWQRWHRGRISAGEWFACSRTLVLFGMQHEVEWAALGYEGGRHPSPYTLVGTRIEAEDRSLDAPDWASAQITPLWRSALVPPEIQTHFLLGHATLSRRSRAAHDPAHATLRLRPADPDAGYVAWHVDSAGKVHGQRVSDSYRQPDLPDPETFRWVPLDSLLMETAAPGDVSAPDADSAAAETADE